MDDTDKHMNSNKKNILIILGSPNDDKGNLGGIALSRLNHSLKIHKKGDLILCTGGWGSHFNTAPKAHAYYAQKYLVSKGIPVMDFLEMALSANTVEDAVKAKEITNLQKPSRITIITSDFHVDRASLIFNEVFDNQLITYSGSNSDFMKNDLVKILSHEKKAIQAIKKNGLYY